MMTAPHSDDAPLDWALAYARLGLRVLPIAPGRKHPALDAWQHAATDDTDTITNWFTGLYERHGVGLAMGDQPSGDHLVCIDLDRHGDGDGVAEFVQLCADNNSALPETWRAVTGSGGRHLIFKTPPGRTARNQQAAGNRIAANIDVRGQGGQILVAPTRHPGTGDAYIWQVAPWTTPALELPAWLVDLVCEPVEHANEPDEHAHPDVTIDGLLSRQPAETGTVTGNIIQTSVADQLRATWNWPTELTNRGWVCDRQTGGDSYWVRPGKNPRHGHSAVLHEPDGPFVVFSNDTTLSGLHRVGKLTTDGSGYALSPFDFYAGTNHGGDRSAAARTLVGTSERRTAAPQGVDPETGEIVAPAAPHIPTLPDEFWTARPVLEQIRQAAHARRRSAPAVLLATLARVAATIPPTHVLPAIIGSQASLNVIVGLVARSGGGKSTAVDVARDLYPIDRKDVVADVPPGSGEGMVELFFELVPEEGADGKTRKVKRHTKTGALVYLDEGEALVEMGNRKGATLMPTLRSAWSGQTLGQSNASTETHRVLSAHSYRLAIVIGFQLEYAADIISNQAGGTPQRFVFAPTQDPTIPDQRPEFPEPLTIDVPPVAGRAEIGFDQAIIDEIDARGLAASRGAVQVESLDSHADLVRMKIAALLAIIDNRFHVTVDDWQLAADVQNLSNHVRSIAIEHSASVARRAENAYTAKLANRDATIAESAEQRALVSGAKSIARKVHKADGALAKRDLMGAVASKHKRLVSVDDMIEHAEQQGWITAVPDGWRAGESKPS